MIPRVSDYVARASYQPNSALTFTSRFRLDEKDYTLRRTELEASAAFGRWTTSVMYGNYDPQPALGFLHAREGILGSARVKLDQNWLLLGAARYDLRAEEISQTQIGVGYIDDCLILALNYIADYAYSGSVSVNRTYYDAGQPAHARGKYLDPGIVGAQHRSAGVDRATITEHFEVALDRAGATRRAGEERTGRRCSRTAPGTEADWPLRSWLPQCRCWRPLRKPST